MIKEKKNCILDDIETQVTTIKNLHHNKPKHIKNGHSQKINFKDNLLPQAISHKINRFSVPKVQSYSNEEEFITQECSQNDADMLPYDIRKMQLDQREKHLGNWELKLIKQQYELEQTKSKLKLQCKELENQSNIIIQQKLELNKKLSQYCSVLEEINKQRTATESSPQKNNISQFKSFDRNHSRVPSDMLTLKDLCNFSSQDKGVLFNLSPVNLSSRSMFQSNISKSTKIQTNFNSINSCQNRIASLLNQIKNQKNSQNRFQMNNQEKSDKKISNFQSQPVKNEQYQPPKEKDIFNYLFGPESTIKLTSVPTSNDKKLNDSIFRTSSPQQVEQITLSSQLKEFNAGSDESPQKEASQTDLDIHDLKIKSIQLNEQLFYRKINMEMDKLKQLKSKLK